MIDVLFAPASTTRDLLGFQPNPIEKIAERILTMPARYSPAVTYPISECSWLEAVNEHRIMRVS